MHKYLTVFLISFSLIAFSESTSTPPTERLEIGINEINIFSDLCPKESKIDGQSTKFGHTVVLVDTTSGFGPKQFTLMDRLIYNEKKLGETPPYDRLSILKLNGKEIQASENRYLFSKCRPRNGSDDTPYDLDKGNFWVPAKQMQKNWRVFNAGIAEANAELEIGKMGNFTQLVEQIKELSRIPDLMFDDSYSSRKLIIVSDLVQWSKNIEFHSKCIKKGSCESWSKIKKNKKHKVWLEAMKPSFGRSSIAVEIIYLNSKLDPKLDKGLKELWEDYFADLGIKNIKFEYETST